MILGSEEVDFKDTDGGGLGARPFSIGGIDFVNRAAFPIGSGSPFYLRIKLKIVFAQSTSHKQQNTLVALHNKK